MDVDQSGYGSVQVLVSVSVGQCGVGQALRHRPVQPGSVRASRQAARNDHPQGGLGQLVLEWVGQCGCGSVDVVQGGGRVLSGSGRCGPNCVLLTKRGCGPDSGWLGVRHYEGVA